MIAVAHPHLFAVLGSFEPTVQQRKRVALWCNIGPAKFGRAAAARDLAALHLTAKLLHHHLLAIANAQDRHAHLKDGGRGAGAALAHHAVGPTREDHGLGREIGQEGIRDLLIGVDFAVNIQLAQATRNKLGHLAAEIDDQKAVVRCLFAHTGL